MRPRIGYGAVVRVVTVFVALWAVRVSAQPPLFTSTFPPEEFALHRAALFAQIGDGIAVVQGAPETGSYLPFRQNNHFFYLTGVEVPRAIALLDGRVRDRPRSAHPVQVSCSAPGIRTPWPLAASRLWYTPQSTTFPGLCDV